MIAVTVGLPESACRPPSPARDRPTGGANTGKALEWLEMALHLRDPGLEQLKTDP